MARPKEFDRQEVLDRAMQLFWEQGFESTSIQDLVDCMGIGRASLYDTFGSKESLIHEAMDCYVAKMKERILDALEQSGPAPKVIEAFFVSLVERGHAGDTRSCLVAKAAMMTGRSNEEIMERVCTFMDTVEDAFHRVLVRGRDEGHIPRDKDPRALARFFVNSMQGLSITSSARAEPRTLADVLATTLSVLR